ncbi:putative signal transducing protein [Nonlabens marinus]|uniref:DUF2007 domain-containing protein n=1 Tax=Nonlabens marinus S1-08 TaxID=1454201 RepID=W8VVV3_9FLAO|nr:DUF2007 domain-containing protein [Nonlabens marinus]BAO55783.1 hypothetical protein NMS_1774 [Nonlabens marinus S1-08]
MNNYIKAYTGSAITINRLADLFQKENITFLIKDRKESARLAGFGSTGDDVELHILESDVDKARPIITAFDNP